MIMIVVPIFSYIICLLVIVVVLLDVRDFDVGLHLDQYVLVGSRFCSLLVVFLVDVTRWSWLLIHLSSHSSRCLLHYSISILDVVELKVLDPIR